MTVPDFSPPAAPLAGNTLTHAVIQPPHATGGDYYGDGSLTVSPYVKGRYTCTSERLADNAVAAPWTLESANGAMRPGTARRRAARRHRRCRHQRRRSRDVAGARAGPSVVPPVAAVEVGDLARQRRHLDPAQARRRAGRDRHLLLRARPRPRQPGLWTLEGDLPPFAATDSGALLRFSACTYVASRHWADPAALTCVAGAPHTVSVAFLAQAPSFTVMPAPMAVMAGAGASFSVVAAGLPTPTLQWQRRLPRGALGRRRRRHGGDLQPVGDHPRRRRHAVPRRRDQRVGHVSSALATLNVVDQASPPAITAVSGPLTVVRGGTAVFAATVKGPSR